MDNEIDDPKVSILMESAQEHLFPCR